MKRPDLITIAGAGLVGSLLGVMLGKRGYRVQIFERRADMRGQDVAVGRSINLALAERGIHSLKKAGLMSAVEPLLIPMRGATSRTAPSKKPKIGSTFSKPWFAT